MNPINRTKKPTPVSKDTVLLSWESFNSKSKDKSFRWYLIAMVIVLIAAGLLVWIRDWFTIIILLIVTGVLFWYTKSTHPKKVTYKITPLGIYADTHFYPFSEIHSFWVIYNEKVKTLYVAFLKKYLPPLIIGLENTDPVALKAVLLRRIPEQEKRTENILDKIVRVIGL